MKRTSWSVSLLAITAICAALQTGCGNKTPGSQLRLQSRTSGKIFSQKLSEAYFSPSNSGEYEIVLIDDEDGRQTEDKPRGKNKTLQPETTPPLRQVIHIRVYWRPPSSQKADSAINASLDWYVSADPASSANRLHYQGTGFVAIHPKGNSATVYIRNAELSLVENSGELHDPIGSTIVSGSATALRNDSMVAAISVPSRLEAISRVRPAGDVQPPRE